MVKPENITNFDRIGIALGFELRKIKQARRKYYSAERATRAVKELQTNFTKQYVDAVMEKDKEKEALLMGWMDHWNQTHPDYEKIRITKEGIRSAIRKKTMEGKDSLFLRAPKQSKKRVMELTQ